MGLVLVFDLGISKGCHTSLHAEVPGVKACFSGISRVKVTNLKVPEVL